MPYVNIKVTATGVTKDHKRQLVQGVTQLLTDVLGKKPEHTHVVIDLVDEQNWGHSGELTSILRGLESAE